MNIKKLIIIAVAATALIGCCKVEDNKDIDKAWCYHGGMGSYTKVVEIEGHQYILMRGYYSGGIIHAASCQCMNK